MIIGNNVGTIAARAFEGCRSLKNIIIPNSVESIGDRSFMDCYNLRTIDIGCKVSNIGDKAFYDCNAIEEIIVDANNTKYCVMDGILYDQLNKIMVVVANNISGKVTIMDGLTSIPDSAFLSESNLNV